MTLKNAGLKRDKEAGMKKAQSVLEYMILLIIIIAAFLTMQVYMKRGFQGRWKQAVDDLGDQYDKTGYHSDIRYTQIGSSESRTTAVPDVVVDGVSGQKTVRTDSVITTETKTGTAYLDP
ncbi:MAG: hypothetical protein V2A70_04255 [Candidatus Omnitrophota bacterium]